MALENAQLQAELRARLEELRDSRARIVDVSREERQATGAEPPRRSAAAAHRALPRAEPARGDARRTTQKRRRASTQPDGDRRLARGAARGRAWAPSGGRQRPRARGRPRAARRRRRRARPPHGEHRLAAARGARGGGVLHRVGEPRQRRRSTRRRRRRASRCRVATSTSSSRSPTTESAAPTRAGNRVARSRGPCGGARRPAARLEPERRRNASAGGDPVRAVIAEDSVLLREGVARVLDDADIDVVGACETADDLLVKVATHAPDIAIVDIRLPPTHSDEGMQAALEIRADHPRRRCPRAVAVRRGRPGDEAPVRLGGGCGLPAQGPDQRRQGVRRRGAARRRGWLRDRPDHRVDAPRQASKRRPPRAS